MAGLGGHLGLGGVSAPVDRISGTAEVSQTGVGFYAALHPWHMDGISGGGG